MPAGTRRTTAAAVALTALAASTVLTGCGGSSTAARPPTTASPRTTGGAAPTGGPPAVAAGSWSRATSAALAVGGGASTTIGGVLAPGQAGGTWTVVGTRTGADESATATVWTSPDATAWTPAALTAPGVASTATAVATFGERTVIVGSVGLGPNRRAAVWVSPTQGAPFAPVPDQAAFAGAEMHVVAAGAIGLIAAGTAGGMQALWYSTDARHFSRLTDAERVIDAAPAVDIRSVVVTQGGVFAAGTRRDGTATDGTIWTSTDGIRWAQQPDAQQAFSGNGNHRIDGLVTMTRGTATVFEAVGAVDTDGTWAPASWISPDGYSWSAPSLSFPREPGVRAAPDGVTVDAVATAGSGLVAVGGGEGTALAWTSTDGRTWVPLALPAAAAAAPWHAGLVAATGTAAVVADPDAGAPRVLVAQGGLAPTAVAVAGAPPAWREATADASVWGSPRAEALPVRLVRDGGTLRLLVDVTQPGQVLGQDHTTVVVLSSTDGAAWTAAPPSPAFADATVTDALPGADGSPLVAVGAQAPTTALLTAGQPSAEAWTSTDVTTWTPATAAGAAFGTGASPTGLTAATRLGGGTLVAVGTGAATAGLASGHPLAWTSPTGATWTGTGSLDRPPSLLAVTPRGACAGPDGAVAVGEAAQASPGRQAVAWTSRAGVRWSRASVPPAITGGSDRMLGCAPVGAAPPGAGAGTTTATTTATSSGTTVTSAGTSATSAATATTSPGTTVPAGSGSAAAGLVAWGGATAADGAVEPAIWQSDTGSTWTRRTVSAFADAPGAPLSDVAQDGQSWLAVGGGNVSASDTAPGGGLGLWRSADRGQTWARVDTSGSPWESATTASVDWAAWLGGTAVVAGTVDGQLAVWLATAGG